VSIVAASALGAVRPAGADPPPATTPAPVVVDVDHRDRATLPDLSPSTPEPLPTVMPITAAPAPPATAFEATHTVTAGEHLWSIAAATVAARAGRTVEALSPAEIAPYWRLVVERNRDRLRSGNPSLLYAGEVIELPPL
jgi:hypothetical protein